MYALLPGLILRTPLLPSKEDYSIELIIKFFKSAEGQECLYLASGDLLMIFNKETNANGEPSQKLKETLYKYYARLTNRTTPFGTFATLSRANWGAESKIRIPHGYKSISKKTKLDSTITTSLLDKIKQLDSYKESVVVKPNTSLYQAGSELRYIQYSTDKSGSRSHRLSASSAEDALLAVVEYAQSGIPLSSITEAFVEQGFPEKVAKAYVHNLLEEQILISTDELTTFGEDRFEAVVSELRKSGTLKSTKHRGTIDTINDICSSTSRLYTETPTKIGEYLRIETAIKTVLEEKSFRTFFQVDSYRRLEENLLEKSIKGRIERALPILNRLSYNAEYERLDTFKTSFNKRFEGRFIPLLEVLDAESGISYGITTLPDDNELTRDLFFSKPEEQQNIVLNSLDQWKLSLLLKNRTGETILLDKEAVKDLQLCPHQLSPTYSITFRVLENNSILIDGVGNASASCMYGRFTDLHPCIKELADDVARVEDEKYGKANGIVAEIVYLPEGKMGNVTQRSAFRKYALPYLGAANSDEIVDAANLVVSVVNNEVVLFDTNRNIRIFPKMSNAHNYSMKSQPVYIFLCDLQYQNVQNYLGFDWGGIGKHFDVLPRLMYKNCILRRKQWNVNISPQQRKDLKKGKISLMSIIEKYKMPNKFIIAEGDNELIIDLNDEVMTSIFKRYLEKSSPILVFEYISPADIVVSESGSDTYANQFIASGTHAGHLETSVPDLSKVYQQTQSINHSTFSPFSEWIYLKIYIGVKGANAYISDTLKKIVEDLYAKGIIESWFFIRYTDPDFHLRVRFKAAHKKSTAHIYNYLHENKENLITSYVKSVSIDTYNREISRYRYIDYDLSEKIFEINSNTIIKLLALDQLQPDWLLCIYAIDALFDAFSTSLKHKLKVIDTMKAMWSYEFQVDKYARKPIQKKFQTHRKFIEEHMAMLAASDPNQPEIVIFSVMKKEIETLIANTPLQLSEQDEVDFLCSHVHMVCNRILPTHARKNELVIYYMMNEYYSGLLHKSLK